MVDGSELTITFEVPSVGFVVRAFGSSRLSLEDAHEIVLRKSDFISPRTLAIRADAAAKDIPRGMIVERLRSPDCRGATQDRGASLKPFTVVANTMQALVKYHGLKNWELRIPYHDSISVNTTSLYSEVKVAEGGEGRLLVAGRRNEDALRRIEHVSKRLTGKPFADLGLGNRLEEHARRRREGPGVLVIGRRLRSRSLSTGPWTRVRRT